MGQAFFQDNIPIMVVASTTSVSIAATNLGQSTRISVGGQQYVPSGTITLSTGGTGANGLDTGSLGAIQLWYVYAIVNQSTFALALVASLTAPATGPTMPSGYGTAYKLVGSFYTNGSSQVGSGVQLTGPILTAWMSYSPVFTAIPGTVSGFFRRSGDSIEIEGHIAVSGAATGNIGCDIPSGLTINTALMTASGNNGALGVATATGTNFFLGNASYNGGVRANGVVFITNNTAAIWNATVPFTWANGHVIDCTFRVPVSSWNPTLL